MKSEKTKNCTVIDASPFLNVVEFCPYSDASDLLAYASLDSLCICLLTFSNNLKSGIDSSSDELVITSEKLSTFDYEGICCISWSPVSNMRYLPRCAKLAFGLENSNICILSTNLKEDTSIMTLHGHTKSINCVSFEPITGSKLASTSDDHTCHVWNVENAEVLYVLVLLYAGVDVSWNIQEPGKLLVSDQSGCLRFYELDGTSQSKSVNPFLSLEADCGTLSSSHWCPTNALRVGAVVGNEWVLWDISNNVLPEETRQAHSGGCTKFLWSRHHDDVFLTQGRPKHTTKIHHLGHRELIFQEIDIVGCGASWHSSFPICAVASNSSIKIYDLNTLSQT